MELEYWMLVYTIQVVILVMMSHLWYSCCISQSPYVPQHPCLPCWHPLSTCQGWPPSEAYISHQPKDTVTPDLSQMNDEGWWRMMNDDEWWWMMMKCSHNMVIIIISVKLNWLLFTFYILGNSWRYKQPLIKASWGYPEVIGHPVSVSSLIILWSIRMI